MSLKECMKPLEATDIGGMASSCLFSFQELHQVLPGKVRENPEKSCPRCWFGQRTAAIATTLPRSLSPISPYGIKGLMLGRRATKTVAWRYQCEPTIDGREKQVKRSFTPGNMFWAQLYIWRRCRNTCKGHTPKVHNACLRLRLNQNIRKWDTRPPPTPLPPPSH